METYRLSSAKPRPWEDSFGHSLEKLESDWLDALKSKRPGRESQVAILVKLLQKNPVKACDAAQDMARKK